LREQQTSLQPSASDEVPMLSDVDRQLFNAVMRADAHGVSQAIACGANVNTQDALLRTPLHLASRDNRTTIVDVLITAGADIESRDANGATPLHYAALNFHRLIDAGKLLVENGADVEAQTARGKTPYGIAIRASNQNFAEMLGDAVVLRSNHVHRLESRRDSDSRKRGK
jgi:ankyrin repeat protein